MPDHIKTATGPSVRWRDALAAAAALVAVCAVLDVGCAGAMAGQSRRPGQWSTPTHRPYPGLEPTQFQGKQSHYEYHGPVSLNHH